MKTCVGILICIVFSFITNLSCTKNNDQGADCLSDALTVRQIVNAPASIFLSNGIYYVIEAGTIDTRLVPCNLPEAFRMDRLQVIVSGDVKSRARTQLEPCCTLDITISTISR